jgi:signal transduction histidine kinase
MRIRTQLFFGTGALVLALVVLGWWLQRRQLEALEHELTEVAAAVGQELLSAPPGAMAWRIADGSQPSPPSVPPDAVTHKMFVFNAVTDTGGNSGSETVKVRVESVGEGEHRTLVVSGLPGEARRIPIPLTDSTKSVRNTLRQGLLASAVLLAAGLAAAALFAHRFTGPLRRLAQGAEVVGQGGFGARIEQRSRGELGELEAAFNRMSTRLAELESERRAWLAREHLAELGDLARGLAHTLRNPLHTLGLAVEELASGGGSDELVSTARVQIRRVDRWLRSFLSLGAGSAAEAHEHDLGDLAREVALEAMQEGGRVRFEAADAPIRARIVAPALRAALANLVANALEASPAQAEVTIEVQRDAGAGMLRVLDRGAGIAEDVRARIFSPHVTTKAAGSGMGLFLAKQLVEAGHGGLLTLADRPGGGTVAEVRIPLSETGS